MSERVEYVVKCDRDMRLPPFSGWFALWRAKREARHLDRVYSCRPHRVIKHTFVEEHPRLREPFGDRVIKRTITEEPVNDA